MKQAINVMPGKQILFAKATKTKRFFNSDDGRALGAPSYLLDDGPKASYASYGSRRAENGKKTIFGFCIATYSFATVCLMNFSELVGL